MGGARLRATLEAAATAGLAAFAWVPFLPRLFRAALTGPADRERMRALLRAGLATAPREPPPGACRPMRVLLVAGEPSGDLHAADLARALRRRCPDVRLEGIGGPRMAAAGVEVFEDLVSDPVMGIWPVVRRAPSLFRLYRDMLVRLATDPPDVLVGVDYPGLNLRLARAARARGVRTATYIAPQVWAWAPWRVRTLARVADRVLCILPFEEPIFAAAGADAAYVGHPLFEHLARAPRDESWRRDLRARGLPLVALLPGSRRAEVAGNLPLLLEAARHFAASRPGARFVVPLAAERLRAAVEAELAGSGLDVTLAPPEHSDDAMAAADCAVSVSGTATLHLVAHAVPAVVVYRTSRSGKALARLLVVSPWIALPNLLSGEEVLPELLAGPRDARRIATCLADLAPGGARREQALAAMESLRERMGAEGAADRAAGWIADLVPPGAVTPGATR